VSNLLTNAAKYTRPGGLIHLTVHCNRPMVALSVSDNGIGMSPEKISKIFEMFSALDGARDHADGGLGIGLALAKRVVALHGGAIVAKSAGLGAGSEIMIHLPLLEIEASAVAPHSAAANPVAKSRALVADDHRDAADGLGLLLSFDDYDVEVVYDGRSALSAAHTFRPDIVLLDIDMPDLNGYEIARAIRDEPWGAAVCLIAVTDRGRREDARDALAAGFDFHLRKPCEITDIQVLIAAHRNRPKR
jgi:two-component system, sensor histidine kinase